ncbi:preprotein translocase subunit SecG [Sphingomonas sp.]|uniref:preprotein translocase subunit SecG n=1 Tax=Sphingomonas sp. TaxID=28214 RepID=UPI003AFFDF4C
MFQFLLVIHAIIAAVLVTVILMQRSEGGGLGMGGSPSGLMSARGAADFLTRMTAITATLFVGLSIVLAVTAATRRNQTIDTSLARRAAATAPVTPQTAPAIDPGAPPAAAPNTASPASPPANGQVPFGQ